MKPAPVRKVGESDAVLELPGKRQGGFCRPAGRPFVPWKGCRGLGRSENPTLFIRTASDGCRPAGQGCAPSRLRGRLWNVPWHKQVTILPSRQLIPYRSGRSPDDGYRRMLSLRYSRIQTKNLLSLPKPPFFRQKQNQEEAAPIGKNLNNFPAAKISIFGGLA